MLYITHLTLHKLKSNLYICILVLLFICPLTSCFGEDWRELKGEHFVVYFLENEKAAKDVLDKAEVYYKDIAGSLGYQRYSEFWIWENRVKIYIYARHSDYLKATGDPSWSQGKADYKKKQIVSYLWSKGFLDSLLPHEIAHLIFRDYVGFKGQVPLWLDEGVAQWAEEAKRKLGCSMARKLFRGTGLFSLEDMMNLDIRGVKETDKVSLHSISANHSSGRVLSFSGENLINTYYIQAISLVGFLVESYGSGDFAVFCRQLRDGKSLEEALTFSYPTYLRSLKELETRWRRYLEEEQ